MTNHHFTFHAPTWFVIPVRIEGLLNGRFNNIMSPEERQHNQVRSDSNMSLTSTASSSHQSALSDRMDLDIPLQINIIRDVTEGVVKGTRSQDRALNVDIKKATDNIGLRALSAEAMRPLRRAFIAKNQPNTQPAPYIEPEEDDPRLLAEVTRQRPSIARKAKKKIVSQDWDEEEEFNKDVSYENASFAREIKPCNCKKEFQEVVLEVSAKNSKNHKFRPLLEAWYKQVGPLRSSKSICFNHTRIVASQMGIATRGVSHQDLLDLLFCFYFNMDKYGDFQVAEDSYQIFKPSRRPQRNEDALLSYRFFPQRILPYIDYDKVIKVLELGDIVKEFQETGNVNVMIFD
jgi:hypothetical protein